MSFAKRAAQIPPSNQAPLAEQIRRCAEEIRRCDAECKRVIDLYLDQEKANAAGKDLPRGVFERMLMNRYQQPWYAVLGLEEQYERARS